MNEELYFSPWFNRDNKKPSTIIQFSDDGDVIKKLVPEDVIVTMNRKANGNKKNSKAKYSRGQEEHPHWAFFTEEMSVTIQNLTATMPPSKKLKILVNCTKSRCNYVACPNIKEFCMLCEVTNDENNEKHTKCTKYKTNFLIVQHGL